MSKNQLKVYHRAFRAYQKVLSADDACRKTRRSIASAKPEKEFIDCTRYSCTVKKDWIERIEKALPFVEKAVMENRQFILQNGSTVPVEQAKRVSRASVEHLARHSEMITHEPAPEADLIPDKVYVVENTDNYAIYENRFLFFLLRQLDEFVGVRYANIVKFWNTFRSQLSLEKELRMGKRSLRFSVNCTESAENEPATSYDGETLDCVERIRNIQQAVAVLRNTPLMKEVSHAPLIKPPITRTNVLRMDPCFREAVALYDFLADYSEDGYTVHETHENTTPFSDALETDLAEVVALVSYLSYRHGGQLDRVMEREYLADENSRREREEQEILARLAQMKRQATESSGSVEEYLRLLEERNAFLEAERREYRSFAERIRRTENELELMNKSERELKRRLEALTAELRAREEAVRRRAEEFEKEKQELIREHEKKAEDLRRALEESEERFFFTMAQLHGLRREHGLITAEDDYTSRERFAELEREFSAFRKFFSEQWKGAKKKIRKNVLWNASDESKK